MITALLMCHRPATSAPPPAVLTVNDEDDDLAFLLPHEAWLGRHHRDSYYDGAFAD